MIRPAVHTDLPAILEVYHCARTFMAANGNPTQWGTAYPAPELVEEVKPLLMEQAVNNLIQHVRKLDIRKIKIKLGV